MDDQLASCVGACSISAHFDRFVLESEGLSLVLALSFELPVPLVGDDVVDGSADGDVPASILALLEEEGE